MAKFDGFNSLLTMGYQNAKLAKSDAAGLGYLSAIMYLAPHKTSGHNVCPNASAGCIASCLFSAGRGRFNNVQHARTMRTKYYIQKRQEFIVLLQSEIGKFADKCAALNLKPAIRLNGTSDIQWEKLIPGVLQSYHNVRFYDYTKNVNRMLKFLNGDFPANYHLTFSRSENNESDCRKVLRKGGNVAVVFTDKNYPAKYMGKPVYNMDEHDLRFLDPENQVGGLYAKGKAKRDTTGFVVPTAKKRGR